MNIEIRTIAFSFPPPCESLKKEAERLMVQCMKKAQQDVAWARKMSLYWEQGKKE